MNFSVGASAPQAVSSNVTLTPVDQTIKTEQSGDGYFPGEAVIYAGRPSHWVVTSTAPFSCAASLSSQDLLLLSLHHSHRVRNRPSQGHPEDELGSLAGRRVNGQGAAMGCDQPGEQLEADAPAAASRGPSGLESAAVVADAQHEHLLAPTRDRGGVAREPQGDHARVGVTHDVADRLLCRPVDQRLGRLVELLGSDDVDIHRHGQTAHLKGRGEVSERGGETLDVQLWWGDGHDEATQLTHPASQVSRRGRHDPCGVLIDVAGPLGRGAEGVRSAGEPLDDPIVQVGRDHRAFLVGRGERSEQQRFALVLAALEAPGHAVGEWRLHEIQQSESAEQHRKAGQPQPPA